MVPLWQGPSSPAGPPRAGTRRLGAACASGGEPAHRAHSRCLGCSAAASGARARRLQPPQSPIPRLDSPGFEHRFEHRSGTGNPTVTTLEKKIAGLESGYGAACFSTGMAATISVP